MTDTLLSNTATSTNADASTSSTTTTAAADQAATTTQTTTAAAGVPEKYDLKLPENAAITDADFASITKLAKELGITKNEAAQKLVDYQNSTVAGLRQSQEQAAVQARATNIQGWEDEIRNDPVIGGANFDKTVNNAKTALARFDTTGEFRKILDSTGYGSNPHVLRVISAIGAAMAEDKFIAGASAKAPRDPAQILYGSK